MEAHRGWTAQMSRYGDEPLTGFSSPQLKNPIPKKIQADSLLFESRSVGHITIIIRIIIIVIIRIIIIVLFFYWPISFNIITIIIIMVIFDNYTNHYLHNNTNNHHHRNEKNNDNHHHRHHHHYRNMTPLQNLCQLVESTPHDPLGWKTFQQRTEYLYHAYMMVMVMVIMSMMMWLWMVIKKQTMWLIWYWRDTHCVVHSFRNNLTRKTLYTHAQMFTHGQLIMNRANHDHHHQPYI